MELTTYVLYIWYLYNIYIGTQYWQKKLMFQKLLLKTTTIYMIKIIHLCDVFVKSIPREGFTFMVKGLSRIEYGSGMDSLTLVHTYFYLYIMQ